MDDFFKTSIGFETACKLLETVNQSTDDYLFIWDIKADARWFFGNIDTHYDVRKDGCHTNSTPELMKIIHPADRKAVRQSLDEIAQGKKDIHHMDYRWINRSGEKVWINCHGRVIRDEKNQPYLMIGRVSEENLRHLYNPQTGLWNKNKLREDLKEILKAGNGYLMLLDIDSLAAINLSHGREYGDNLLKEVAELCENLEGVCAAYHVDHNHFALVLAGETEAQVQDVFAAVKERMREKCTFTASAVPIDNNLFYDETQLLDTINMTMKKAKTISNDHIEFFSPEDLSKKVSDFALLEELKHSVENGFEGFYLVYQPQVRCHDYALCGVEALLRYESKSRGRVFPDEFIPVLEESRLIDAVGLWVLREAAAQCKKWRKVCKDLRVSVNFSAVQFKDETLGDKIVQTLRSVGLKGSALTIEVTESVGVRNRERLENIIKQFQAYRVGLAIDDFGTGYSNLAHLKQMNVDEIKIDRMFVSGIEKNSYNHKLISNVIEFARDNDIRTCCEGVETFEELAIVELLMPDMIQGYLFDKPTSAQNIEDAYMNPETPAYQSRLAFLQKLYEFTENQGMLRFDHKDILRENGIGLWVMRVKDDPSQNEFYSEEIMESLLAVNKNHTPKERYDYWLSHVHPEYVDYVKEGLAEMARGERTEPLEFMLRHPKLGDIRILMRGKRVHTADGKIVLKGYYRNITEAPGK